ncbi:hypothetical protein GIB67_006205 [Kingdonia uniflora]|uniref:Uncharacterized protein n=1 Tax=Kingdonia uniflora TaxID=39325 RepID=A0A7J7N6M2_9MAGN|nr:hypothetical protein GIB67_006205 [Kingdonia uniflora]
MLSTASIPLNTATASASSTSAARKEPYPAHKVELRPDTFKEEGSSRGARKFEKKVQFYTIDYQMCMSHVPVTVFFLLPEVKDTVASLNASKAIGKRNGREQLLAVINHPNYQSNPLAAIQRHLESTQPVIVEEPKKKTKKTGKKSRLLLMLKLWISDARS